MKKLLLLLAATSVAHAFADSTVRGNVTPACNVIATSPSTMLNYKPGTFSLHPGECIQLSQWSPGPKGSISSPYNFQHVATLVFQYDQNVVLYAYDSYYDATSVTALNTVNSGATVFVYQEDKNLVLYNNNNPLYATGTDNRKAGNNLIFHWEDDLRYAGVTLQLASHGTSSAMDYIVLHTDGPRSTPVS